MRQPGVFSAFTFSFFFHVLLVGVSLIVITRTHYHMPSPYVVTLVADTMPPAPSKGVKEVVAPPEEKVMPQEEKIAPKKEEMVLPKAKEKVTKEEENRLKDRLEALEAKKRIEKLVKLRRNIDVSASKVKKVPVKQPAAQSSTAGTGTLPTGDYYSLVITKIRQQWDWPESLDRDYEAVVSVTIARDGTVKVHGFEKKSGNPLFDRSVLRAITKASPLPQPPQEIEMGVKFRP